jgi:hypothetical protein
MTVARERPVNTFRGNKYTNATIEEIVGGAFYTVRAEVI